ncbi:F-box only protein 21-like [Anoplolepis gracilipes]|uniref:F-box only protein 21-like n=1 Tax=Anoplolepis gracilipes TaxID=354296 RepID=UPI003B9E60CF
MATIKDLPSEVLEMIFSYKDINLEDIINLKSTCKRLWQIELRNQVWKEKFYQRCYTARMKYMKRKTKEQKKKFAKLNFEKQITKGIKSIRKLQDYVHLMSEDKLCDITKKELECLLHFIAENSMIYYFVYDELNRIISAELPWLLHSALTTQYNFHLILNCLKQNRFIYNINKFMKMPREKQILEKLFTILAQYFKPHISCSVIKTWLDDITQEFLSCFKEIYPAHLIFKTSSEQFSFWKDNNIDDHFWNIEETRQIVNKLYYFIYHLRRNYYDLLKLLDTNNLKIRELLRDFRANQADISIEQNVTLSMCHCIGRRLGVRCAVVPYVSDLNRIAIIWKPKYYAERNRRELFHINKDSYQIYPYTRENYIYEHVPDNDIEVIRKTIINFLSSNLGSSTYLLYNWNVLILDQILSDITNIEYSTITNTIQVEVKQLAKVEKKEAKFTVGMIVRHLCKKHRFCYEGEHVGVIIGYDYTCDKESFSEKLRMSSEYPYLHRYDKHSFSMFCCQPDLVSYIEKVVNKNQPHYTILVDNNKICYIEEEALSTSSPKWIKNVEIGRYFSEFLGTYYLPNRRLAKFYPDDTVTI